MGAYCAIVNLIVGLLALPIPLGQRQGLNDLLQEVRPL